MQKKRRRSFRKKIKLPLHKTPAQRFGWSCEGERRRVPKSREKIAKNQKCSIRQKAVKQKGKQKEKKRQEG